MQTLRELVALVRESAVLWWSKLPLLGFWLCLGFAGREASIYVSVLFGPNRLGATLSFVAGMVIWVVCLVLMLHAVTRTQQSYFYDTATEQVAEVQTAGTGRTRADVLTQAVVPFLAVWSAWGFTEDHVQRVFNANMIHYGIDATNYSITFAAWQTYLVIAAVAWALQAVVEIVGRRRGGVLLAIARIFLRGTAILTAFLGLDSVIRGVVEWAATRQFWAWGRNAWEGFKDFLPDWTLWWNQTVPEFVQYLVDTAWQFVIPGLWLAVLLPIVWLALTATVVGWESLQEVLIPGRVASRMASGTARVRELRPVQHLETAAATGPLHLLKLWLRNQADDVLPAIHAFRLIVRSGWPFVAAYLMLGAAVQAIGTVVGDVALLLIGPQAFAPTMRYLPLVDLAADFLMWTAAVALYATAFERAMRVTIARQATPAPPQTQPVAG